MAMGRVYKIVFNKVSISAVQDLFNAAATSGMAFELHDIVLGAESVTGAEEISIQIKRMTATVTNGTGGSTATPGPTVSSMPAATVTARVNDATTRATTSGSTTVLHSDTWQLTNGYVFQWAPEDRIQFNPSQNLIVGLETAPSAAHVCSGTITIAELL